MWVLFGLFFTFSNFYQLDSHYKTRVAFSKPLMKNLQKLDWKLDLPLFSYGTYRKCMYVDFSTGDIIGPPNCATIECRVVINVEDIVQPPLNMCLYDVCTLILTNPHTNQISVGRPIPIPFSISIHRVTPLKS
jgi:hypothetical protein